MFKFIVLNISPVWNFCFMRKFITSTTVKNFILFVKPILWNTRSNQATSEDDQKEEIFCAVPEKYLQLYSF